MQQQQSQPARVELAPFINESESRAIILFHSAHLSTVDIRNACSKYGVLYYIRPEFHGKGVTLISYFDLRAASAAKASIVEDLGRSADASAHFSVMLHAANGNSEEFRLVVRNLPADRCSEAEVQSIFARYGQLRSIQKTFEEGGGVEGAVGSNSTSEKTDGGATATATAAGTSDGAHADESNCSTNGSNDGDGAEDSDSCKIAYSIEFYNIQDARLAASELSATSAQLWNADVTVKFAPLDERKQQLCKQLLATLSRWRSEMASAMAYNMSLQQQQQQFHQQQQAQQQAYMQQQQQGRQMMMGGNGMLGNVSMGMNMGMMSPMVYGMPQQHQQQQQSQQVMAVGGMVDMNGGMSGGMSGYGAPQLQQQQQLSQFQQQPMVNSGSYTDLTLLQHQQNQQMAMAMNMPPGPAAMPMPMQQLQQQQRVLYGTAPSSVDGSSGTLGGAMGVGGGVPVVLRGPSPMHALMPANLSNPNLFNLGLLAAQAEAQMQQQQIQQQQMQQQQASMHQHQGQSVSPVPQSAGGSTEAGSFGSEGSPAGAAQYAR